MAYVLLQTMHLMEHLEVLRWCLPAYDEREKKGFGTGQRGDLSQLPSDQLPPWVDRPAFDAVMPRPDRVRMYWDAMLNSDLNQRNKFFELRNDYQAQAAVLEPNRQRLTKATSSAAGGLRGIFMHPDVFTDEAKARVFHYCAVPELCSTEATSGTLTRGAMIREIRRALAPLIGTADALLRSKEAIER